MTRNRPPGSGAHTNPQASVFDGRMCSDRAQSSASDLISASGVERIWSSSPNTYRDSSRGRSASPDKRLLLTVFASDASALGFRGAACTLHGIRNASRHMALFGISSRGDRWSPRWVSSFLFLA